MERPLLAACAAFGLLASPAFGKSIQCDHTQTHCIAENTELTIGDRVGIFNDDGELVAKGEVKAMRGERRAVLIDERHGEIHKGYHLALLERSPATDDAVSTSSLRIYHEPAKIQMGASAGYSEVGIGDGSPASEFSVYAQWRKWGGLQLVMRGVYTAMEGNVSHQTATGTETLPISMSGIGLLGGVGYVARENKTVSFRTEVAAGGMDVNASVGGSKSLLTDNSTNARVKNGFGLYGRASLGPVWNLDSWHLSLEYAPSLVYQAFSNTLAAGVSKDLK